MSQEDSFEGEFRGVSGGSPDFRSQLARDLAALVPEAVADGLVDVEKLRELLAEDAADDGRERFGLMWPGKSRALRAAQAPTTATLVPDREASKDWDTTQNVFIEGDNLEVLKVLQRHYFGKIKLIYIDPPYNTGKDFIYPDNYKEGLQTYLEWTRQVSEDNKKLSSNTETEGRYHSNWLNMMYPRLKLARNLLTEDGVLFVSIDDSERDSLFRIMSEIFGETNFVASLVWSAGRKNDSKFVSVSHEYMLVFARNFESLRRLDGDWKTRKKGIDEIYQQADRAIKSAGRDFEQASRELKSWFSSLDMSHESKRHRHYSNIDENGVYFAGDISWPGGGGPTYEVLHPLTKKPVRIPAGGWRFSEEVMFQKVADGSIKFGKDETSVPTVKRYLRDTEKEVPYSVFYQDGRAATKRLAKIFGTKVFDFPKDETVISELVKMATSAESVVLDFFSGSGSTAHAVMALNAEDGGSRRHIQVQLPEPVDPESEAGKAGFGTIADIARERIRRAGEKVKEEFGEQLASRESELDVGFRAYRLSDTNFVKWRVSSGVDQSALEATLAGLRGSADDGATPEALLTELLIKQGYSLTESVEQLEISGLSVWSVAEGALLAVVDEQVKPTLDQLRAVVEWPDVTRLVVLEDVFAGDDQLKTNLVQHAKTHNVELWSA